METMTENAPPLPDLVSYRPPAQRSTAVVFVHGFTGTAEETWGEFPKLLCNDPALGDYDIFSWGYHTKPELKNLVLRYFWTDNPSIATIANGLRTQLDHRTDGHKRLMLIGHSMGGLAIQAFIVDELLNQRSKHLERLTEVVLLGTPSGGLVKAQWGALLDPEVHDMSATGDFVLKLRRHWKELVDDRRANPEAPARFRLTLVAGMKDKFVPETRSLDPFPLDEKERVPGNHIEMVKPAGTGSVVYAVIKHRLTRKNPTQAEWETIHGRSPEAVRRINRVRVSAELGDVADLEELADGMANEPMMPLVDRALGLALLEAERYQAAVHLLERYLDFHLPPADERPFGRDTQAIQQLAIALSGDGQVSEAVVRLRELGADAQEDPETMGIIAGRFKRRWLKSRTALHIGKKARDLYLTAFQIADRKSDADQIIFNGINAAYLDFALGGTEYRKLAQRVLDVCRQSAVPDYWAEATAGEASLLLGDFPAAEAAYRAAQAHLEYSPRRWATTGQQGLDILNLLNNPAGGETIRALFATVRRDY